MELEGADDDEGGFLAAAREDDALVARLLISLSRSENCAPWQQQQQHRLSKPSPTWGRRRARSGAPEAGAKRDEERAPAAASAGGASPATPLSWSGASGTSGSGSDDGCSTPPRPPKRRQQQHQPTTPRGEDGREQPGQPPQPTSRPGPEICPGWGEQIEIGTPPARGTPPDSPGGGCSRSSDGGGEPHRESVVTAPPVAGSPAAGSGSSKATAVPTRVEVGPARSAARARPSRSRWTAEIGAAAMTGVGRPGKKKTLLELRAMEDSLMREQEQLHKELGKQREVYAAMLRENMSLKKLESSLPSIAVSNPHVVPLFGEASSERARQSASERQGSNGVGSDRVDEGGGREQALPTSSSSSFTQALAFRFDLNCVPDGDI